MRAPGSHTPSGLPRRIGIVFAYIGLTCEKVPSDQYRLHVRAHGAGHRIFAPAFG